MPIKHPEHYPDDWPEIRQRILSRADHRCECVGECGYDHSRLDADARCIERDKRSAGTFGRSGEDPWVRNKRTQVVLTVAHLDHDASAGDHSDSNLKALCQACHLRYDGWSRRRTADPNQDALC